jgi:hypothetical protein
MRWFPLLTKMCEGSEIRGVSDISGKKKRARCKAENKVTCNHYDHPPAMMVLGHYYQARCSGCETVGPVVSEGPWVAQQALYSVKVHKG